MIRDKINLIIQERKKGRTWQSIADELGFPKSSLTSFYSRHKDLFNEDIAINQLINPSVGNVKKEKEPDDLLAEHGYDKNMFELIRATSNQWSMNGYDNFQSKIQVKPLIDGFDKLDTLLECVKDTVSNYTEKIEISNTIDNDNLNQKCLLIPLYDLHIGFNDHNDYQRLLINIISKIKENNYNKIIIVQGGDFFHVDNVNGTTLKGTYVGEINITNAIEDAYNLIVPILNASLESTNNVEYIYLPGNHAPTVDLVFAKMLEGTFSNVTFMITNDELKRSVFGYNELYFHHGDKQNIERMTNKILTYHNLKNQKALNRYCFTGHFHHELTKIKNGITFYQVQSPSKNSEYEKKYGFDYSEQGQMLFEFDEFKRVSIHYI